MFTGIIEKVGKVKNIKKNTKSTVLSISVDDILNEVKLGDSIAINGVCLTVTSFNSDNNTINIKQVTSNEVLCIKKTLNACGYNVTIELLDTALYQLHFNF